MIAIALAACGDDASAPDDARPVVDAGPDAPAPDAAVFEPCASWPQWGHGAAHDGASCAAGQRLRRLLADIVYDPFTAEELADADGNLLIHYQVPLIDGNDVYAMVKTGVYTPCDQTGCGLYRLNSQVWTERHYAWTNGTLTPRWSFDSDWKPVPGLWFEPTFQPALAGELIAIPAAGGHLWELDRRTGQLARAITPFGEIDVDRYVAGGLAVGPDGSIYYNAIRLDHDQPYQRPAQSWLVVVAPDGTTRLVDYATLVPGAPAADDLCYGTFDGTTPRPWPPAPNPDGSPVLPAQAPCGAQRPGINNTPTIAADGTIVVTTRAHFNDQYSYVVALRPDLTVAWATSLRGLLHDGCGVLVPSDGTATEHLDHCRVGATAGVDPATNLQPAARVTDDSSSAPVALPDGGVVYGSVTGYDGRRGHLLKLDAAGSFVASYDFGWDTTPAITTSGTDYRIIIKDNRYGRLGGYDTGPFFLTALDASMNVVWRFRNTETQNCVRQPDGTIVCTEDHPNGFEWCINALAVDRDGTTYANAEDGYLYAIDRDGQLRDRIFLDRALGAAYTPLAIDPAGRIFAMNAGRLIVAGD